VGGKVSELAKGLCARIPHQGWFRRKLTVKLVFAVVTLSFSTASGKLKESTVQTIMTSRQTFTPWPQAKE
jgi:hypothetical protein